MYCERLEDAASGAARVRVEREFREQPPQPPWEVEINMGEEFEATIREWNVVGQLEALISDNPDITVTQAADVLGLDKRTVIKRAYDSPELTVVKGGRGRATRLVSRNGSE